MSIIYRALQKTQKTREKTTADVLRMRPDWIIKGMGGLIVLLFGAVLYSYLSSMHFPILHAAPVVKTPAPVPVQVVSEDAFKTKYFLNGIFMSDKTKMAMINSQYFHIGDMIDGFRIYHICDKDVKLRNEHQQIITLEVPV